MHIGRIRAQGWSPLWLFALLTISTAQAQLKVASMHPIIGDLARQIGGEQVEVIELLPLHLSAHQFDPTPDVLKQASTADLVLASGKHLENNWIEKVRDNLPAGAEIIEVGRRIPSLLIDPKDALFSCCPDHTAGAIDPHWWHSIKNMQRAARITAEALAAKDPNNKDAYRARAKAYDKELASLTLGQKSRLLRFRGPIANCVRPIYPSPISARNMAFVRSPCSASTKKTTLPHGR